MLASFLISAAVAAAQPPVVVLDPGHGGQDWGATIKGAKEKDIVLAVAKRLKALLEKDGAAEVRLTRSTDDYVQLDKRVQEGALFVSLHANLVRQKNVRGMIVYAWGRDRIRKGTRGPRSVPPLPPPPKDTAKAGRELAASLGRALRTAGFPAENDHADLYVLKNPDAPSILIELGFLSNPKEAALLEDEKYQDKLAAAMAGGLTAYLSAKPATSAGR